MEIFVVITKTDDQGKKHTQKVRALYEDAFAAMWGACEQGHQAHLQHIRWWHHVPIFTWISFAGHLLGLADYTYLSVQGDQVDAYKLVLWISISLTWMLAAHLNHRSYEMAKQTAKTREKL